MALPGAEEIERESKEGGEGMEIWLYICSQLMPGTLAFARVIENLFVAFVNLADGKLILNATSVAIPDLTCQVG